MCQRKKCSKCDGVRNSNDFHLENRGLLKLTNSYEFVPKGCENWCLNCVKEKNQEIKEKLTKCHKCKKELTTPYFQKNLNEYDEYGNWKYERVCEPCMEKQIEQKEIWDVSTVGDWNEETGSGTIRISACKYCHVYMPDIRKHETKDGKVVKLKHNCETKDEEIKKFQKDLGDDKDNDDDDSKRERERESKIKKSDCWFRSHY